MKTPKSVNIGAVEYAIIEVPDLVRLENCRGRCDHTRLEIWIEQNDLPIIKTATLYHEIMHCVDQQYLQGILCDNQVDALGNGWHQAMRSMGIEIVWLPTQGDCL